MPTTWYNSPLFQITRLVLLTISKPKATGFPSYPSTLTCSNPLFQRRVSQKSVAGSDAFQVAGVGKDLIRGCLFPLQVARTHGWGEGTNLSIRSC